MSAPCEPRRKQRLLELLPSDFQQEAWYDSSIAGRDGDGAVIYLDNNATTFLTPAVRDRIGSLIAGGEGLVMRFRGNGHVWVQTRNLASLADKLTPFLPQPRGQ